MRVVATRPTIAFAGRMWIYLLRHGIAENPTLGQPDEQRALTPQGWERLERASEAWQKLVLKPNTILCSPYLRACETASVLAKASGYDGALQKEDALVPHAQTAQAIAALEGEMLQQTSAVALVGHEPHLGYLLGSLVTGHPRISIPFGRGQLVGLETESTTSLTTTMRFSMRQSLAAKLT